MSYSSVTGAARMNATVIHWWILFAEICSFVPGTVETFYVLGLHSFLSVQLCLSAPAEIQVTANCLCITVLGYEYVCVGVCVCGSLCHSCDDLVTSPGSFDELIDVNKFLIIGYRIKIERVLFLGISIGHTPSCQNTKSCDKDLHYLTTITVRTFHKWFSAPVVHILLFAHNSSMSKSMRHISYFQSTYVTAQ